MEEIRQALAGLIIYSNILHDPVFIALKKWLKHLHKYGAAALTTQESYYQMLQSILNTGTTFKQHLLYLLEHDDNLFSQQAENTAWEQMDQNLLLALAHDLTQLQTIYQLEWSSFMPQALHLAPNAPSRTREGQPIGNDIAAKLRNSKDWSLLGPELARHYYHNSRGLISLYEVFLWDSSAKKLVGVENPDTPAMSDIFGCIAQKQQLSCNTEIFLREGTGNNVLLYGPRGTGKSSLIKSLVTQYHDLNLKLIEMSREQLNELPLVADAVRCYPRRRFIMFIDDLSFEDYETGYKGLKALLEGSIKGQPPNMLIYATSNRRNLVKEFFTDRGRLGDEVHYQDTMQEKLSLADRFGLTITFPAPNKQLYLDIVEHLVQQRGFKTEPEWLRQKALEWERTYHGPSGRSARQFVDSLSQNSRG